MERINSFAVVAYIEDRVGRFVDSLRRELTPGCPHHAHVTILPPRPLSIPTEDAIEQCRQILTRFEPFEFRVNTVGLFEKTRVIKLTLETGLNEFRTLHDILNTGPFEKIEEYDYVPHITLCQDVPVGKLEAYLGEACQRWEALQPATPIHVEKLTIVQQTTDGTWENLADMPLGSPELARVRR
jgi:2'-5' RNA ligase